MRIAVPELGRSFDVPGKTLDPYTPAEMAKALPQLKGKLVFIDFQKDIDGPQTATRLVRETLANFGVSWVPTAEQAQGLIWIQGGSAEMKFAFVVAHPMQIGWFIAAECGPRELTATIMTGVCEYFNSKSSDTPPTDQTKLLCNVRVPNRVSKVNALNRAVTRALKACRPKPWWLTILRRFLAILFGTGTTENRDSPETEIEHLTCSLCMVRSQMDPTAALGILKRAVGKTPNHATNLVAMAKSFGAKPAIDDLIDMYFVGAVTRIQSLLGHDPFSGRHRNQEEQEMMNQSCLAQRKKVNLALINKFRLAYCLAESKLIKQEWQRTNHPCMQLCQITDLELSADQSRTELLRLA